MQDLPNKLSIEEYRKLIPEERRYSNKQVKNIRDVLYKLANVVIQKFGEIKNYITRVRTIEAKAKIVHN